MTCPKCGTELPNGVKFCPKCGYYSDSTNGQPQNTNTTETSSDMQTLNSDHSADNSVKSKLIKIWSSLSMFSKIAAIAMAIVIILLIIAICTKTVFAIVFSVLQLAGLIVAVLMNKDIIILQQQWIKYIVLAAAIMFSILNIASYSWGKGNKPNNPSTSSQPQVSDTSNSNAAPGDTSVTVPLSSADCLGKNYSDIYNALSSAGFVNIETEIAEDLQSAEADKIDTVDTILIADKSDFEQGQEFNKNDKVVIRYHAYKKCKVKVNVEFPANLIFSKYDVKLLIDGIDEGVMKHGEGKEYEFALEPKEYSITFESADYSSVKGEVNLIVDCDLEASYKVSCHSDKIDIETLYVDRSAELSENETKLDVAASEYKNKNYEDVKSALEKLGFTNIKFEIMYDIVFGITADGTVESVSIADNKDFKRGDVFPKDAKVVIVYHMPENSDPSNITITKGEIDYIDKNYLEVEQELKDLGFTNIILDKHTTYDQSLTDGSVYSVSINDMSFKSGDVFKPNAEITIMYYAVAQNITVENNTDFAALMKITDQTDTDTIKKLIAPLIDNIVEFDGCIVLMMNHNNYKTRFDVCLAGVDYEAERVYGPLFSFEDVSFYDMDVSGTDTVAQGMNFRITAKVKGFDDKGNTVILEPVSLVTR